jgi:hypothetical protein
MFTKYALAFFGQRLWRQFEPLTVSPLATPETMAHVDAPPEPDTMFRGAHSFAEIRSLEDYRTSVPWGDYESIRPYVQGDPRGEGARLNRRGSIYVQPDQRHDRQTKD